MTNLLKTESLKLKKYKAFWWMAAMVALSYPGINWIFFQIYKGIREDQQSGQMVQGFIGNPFAAPDVWPTVAYSSSWFVFIPAIIVIMFITNEYTYKTHRQNIIDGWSRNEFMVAKLFDVLLVSFIVTLLYTVVALVIGQINAKESTGTLWSQSKYIGLFFLQTFSQLSLAFLIAFLVRKAFIALGLFIFQFLILENILSGLGKKFDIKAAHFLPFEISDRMIPYPRFFGRVDPDSYNELLANINNHIVYTIILLCITWGFCFWLNKRRDL